MAPTGPDDKRNGWRGPISRLETRSDDRPNGRRGPLSIPSAGPSRNGGQALSGRMTNISLITYIFERNKINSLWYNVFFKKAPASPHPTVPQNLNIHEAIFARPMEPPSFAGRVPGARYLRDQNLHPTLPLQTSQGADSEGTLKPHDRPGPGPRSQPFSTTGLSPSFLYPSSARGRQGGHASSKRNSMNQTTTFQEA